MSFPAPQALAWPRVPGHGTWVFVSGPRPWACVTIQATIPPHVKQAPIPPAPVWPCRPLHPIPRAPFPSYFLPYSPWCPSWHKGQITPSQHMQNSILLQLVQHSVPQHTVW